MHSPITVCEKEPEKKSTVINLFGGAGIGKSTLAAHTFFNMKCMNLNCELVTEFAKELVWQESYRVLDDELYVFANQHNPIKMVADKVDYVVTDSPIILPIIYDKEYGHIFREFVLHVFSKYNNVNFVLERRKRYNPVGRLQANEEEARKLDVEIRKLLDTEKIPYHVIDDPVNGWDVIKRVLDLEGE